MLRELSGISAVFFDCHNNFCHVSNISLIAFFRILT